jgi:hypothetical protein
MRVYTCRGYKPDILCGNRCRSVMDGYAIHISLLADDDADEGIGEKMRWCGVRWSVPLNRCGLGRAAGSSGDGGRVRSSVTPSTRATRMASIAMRAEGALVVVELGGRG